MITRISDDTDLGIDPREHVIESYGHGRYYTSHQCPICETSSECKVPLCRLESTIECLPCATRELLSDTERIAKEAYQFLQTEVPTDAQGLMWWKALGNEVDGKLKGLVTRSKDLIKRQEQEVVRQ